MLHPPRIDPERLRQLLGDPVVSAAEALLVQKPMVEVRQLQGGAVVTGVVQSPNARVERVYIQQLAESVDGECSCEQGFNCVHVAAVLIQSLRDAGDGHGVATDRQTRGQIGAVSASRGGSSPQQMLYLLEASPRNYPWSPRP